MTYSPEPRNSIGGPGGASPSFFNGTMDDLRVYNRALSISEIQTLCMDTIQVTSIFETSFIESDINVYPNPATDVVTIKWSNSTTAPQQIKFLDATGKLIYMNNEVFDNHIEVSIKDLERGVYFVQMSFRENVLSEKIIIE